MIFVVIICSSHVFAAALSGILFILATKQVLGGHESEEELGPDSLNVGWEKMVLIMFVMTLHSLTEGVGACVHCALCCVRMYGIILSF